MSPTLLEAVIILVLLVLSWQIGIQLTPLVLRYWRTAKQQLDQIDESSDRQLPPTPPVGPPLSSRKENDDGQASRTEQPDSPHVA